jgi:2'-5' RNA ligase
MTGIRCFVAVDLPGEMRDAIGRLQSRIATKGLRLVQPELVHVTIKFLGEVPETKVERVTDALSKVTIAPFPALVASMGTFPERGDIRVVWLGLEGNFEELFQLVESALGTIGFEREARGFSPHVTLGRVGRPGPETSRELHSKIASINDVDLGRFTVDRFCLKKSTLTRGGPIYEDLAGFAL